MGSMTLLFVVGFIEHSVGYWYLTSITRCNCSLYYNCKRDIDSTIVIMMLLNLVTRGIRSIMSILLCITMGSYYLVRSCYE